MKKSYREMIQLETFEERLEYLYIGDQVCRETFGNSRWINQQFYKSYEWGKVRNEVIARDLGCDLGIDGCDLQKRNIIIHHINPITEEDLLNRDPKLLDPNNLISTSLNSHNYIHYGVKTQSLPIERTPNDTCPWRIERR